jgi:hypothetical protein
VDLDEVQVWDLLAAFDRLMKEVAPRKRVHEVTYDDTPIDLHAADIEDRLKREGRLTLRTLIVGRRSRSEMIGVFLALLELIREKKILVKQTDDDLIRSGDRPRPRGTPPHVRARLPRPSRRQARPAPARRNARSGGRAGKSRDGCRPSASQAQKDS